MKAGPLVNMLVMLTLAMGLAFASFAFVRDADFLSEESLDTGSIELGSEQSVDQTATLRLHERDSVSLLPGSTATVNYDKEAQAVTVELSKGAAFFATTADDFSVSVVTSFARVDSQNSSAGVVLSESGESLEVFALEYPSLVTFTANGEDLNALLVPTGYRMKIPASKITDTLARLRLTKLTKEFPVFEYEDAELSSDLVATFEASQAAYSNSSVAFLQAAQADGHFGPARAGLGSFVSKAYELFEEILTVLPEAQAELDEAKKENALEYGMTNLLFGERSTGEGWIAEWQAASPDPEEVDELYSELFFALPGDELYPIKAAAAEILYPHEEPLTALRRQFQEIEGLLARGSLVDAQTAYADYQTKFEAALDSGTLDDEVYLDDISREYYLLELMLRSNAVFYSGDSVHLLTELEDKILSLAGSDQDLDEERQAFVQSKLRYLANLFNFVTELKISVEDATELANDLVSEAEKYLSEISSQVAVKDYFTTKLADYDLSILFMNSPEFYSYDDFDEGLEAYRLKVKDLEDLNAYLQNLRSQDNEIATVSLEEAIAEVEADLRANSIQYSGVESLGDSANRLFEIVNGRTGGYSFTANYDRETQILYDTVVDEIRFPTGITLENASEVIKEAMEGEPQVEEEVEEEVLEEEDEQSLTESVALKRVEQAFEDAEIDLEKFTFAVVDLDDNTFTFEGTASYAQLPVTGIYDLDTNQVSEVVWQLDGSPKTLPDMDLADFEEALYATYQALVGY
jgi:hypothetical protein